MGDDHITEKGEPMTWMPANDSPEDAYWEERRQREREQAERNPHTLERWFRRSVHNYIRGSNTGPADWWLTDGLLDWYWKNRDKFLTFTNVEKYSGEGWSSGQWSIDFGKVEEWLLSAIHRDDPAGQIDFILSEILSDRDALHQARPVPNEPFARKVLYDHSTLSVKEQEERLRKLERLRDRWPRPCVKCREFFVPTTKIKARAVTKCDNCKPRKRRAAQ